jgi:hypothetical protein
LFFEKYLIFSLRGKEYILERGLKNMARVSKSIRKFLEDFEEACRKRGGIAVRDSTLDFEYAGCRFEGKAPTVRVYAESRVYPEKEWRLSICIDTSCADASELDELHIFPMGVSVYKEKRLCGYVEFDGVNGLSSPEAILRYVLEPKDGLKEIRVYAREDRIDMDLVQ